MAIPTRFLDVLVDRGRMVLYGGIEEVALEKSAALEAVSSLRGTCVAIIGGEVYKVINGRPSISDDNWCCIRRKREKLHDYLRRSWDLAEQFILDYRDPENGTVLYSLVLIM